MSAPRHRLERDQPLLSYEPQIPLRASDFDAVAPIRRLAVPARDQWAEEPTPSSLDTSDALYLAHS
jgi:hypothetical protein